MAQHHQVADAHFTHGFRKLLAHGRRTASDNVSLLHEILPAQLVARLRGGGAELRLETASQGLHGTVTRSVRKSLEDVQAAVVEIVRVFRVELLGLGVGVGNGHQLQEPDAIRVGFHAALIHDFPEAVRACSRNSSNSSSSSRVPGTSPTFPRCRRPESRWAGAASAADAAICSRTVTGCACR